MFRHCVKIPTVEEYIEQLSPGLSELTKTSDEIVFWFYSLEAKKYLKYVLGADMKITHIPNASTLAVVNDLENKFYFNFVRQRWEKKEQQKNNTRPIINKDRNIVEQKYSLCYIDGDKTICEETRNQAFVKLKIRDVNYVFNEKTLQLELDIKSTFPEDVSETMCKFSMNRYKESLGLDYDQNSETDNTELDIGVYFLRDGTKWVLRECTPSVDDMYFDGTTCRQRENLLKASAKFVTQRAKRVNVVIAERISEDASPGDLMRSHYIKLNASHSAYVNLNAAEKIYSLDVDFYKSCHYTFFIVGSDDEKEWKLEQMINGVAKRKMMATKQQWCPVLEEPRKVFDIRAGSTLYLKQPFVFYMDFIFYMREIFLGLHERILGTRQYTIMGDEEGEENGVKNKILLPHVRRYVLEDMQLFATFAGNSIFDIYAETRLLETFIKDMHKYEFYDTNLFPSIDDDFQLGVWACVIEVAKPEMFTYISLADMFGLDAYARTINEVKAT